ncbi:MAG: hypothetical protein Q8O23_01940 [Gallionella sp.]|nr:hypothetical protein [Gallionella sp.]
MSGFLNGDYRVDHTFHHVPVGFFMGFVAKYAARETKGRLHFLHLGIEHRTLSQQISVSVKSDVTLLAITGDFHCIPRYVQSVLAGYPADN